MPIDKLMLLFTVMTLFRLLTLTTLWFKQVLESKFEITTTMIGHDKDDTKQVTL